jgi:hypothetical protein
LAPPKHISSLRIAFVKRHNHDPRAPELPSLFFVLYVKKNKSSLLLCFLQKRSEFADKFPEGPSWFRV